MNVNALQLVLNRTLIIKGGTFEVKKNMEAHFTMYTESSYEFDIKKFHIELAFEITKDWEDYHLRVVYGF